MMKKQKDIDILRRFILYSRRSKRPVAAQRVSNHPLVREIVEEEGPAKETQKEELVKLDEQIEPTEQMEPV